MRHQSYPAITRARGHLKAILLAVLLLLNLAAHSWGQTPADAQSNRAYSNDRTAPATSSAFPSNILFALVVGAGLLVAGGTRQRKRRAQPHAPAADFEMALRMQNVPRVRVDQTPLFRDRSVCLRRTASRLGCDQ